MKLKTKRAAHKRFKFTSTGKVTHRHVGQAHFNSRNSGKAMRSKRGDNSVDGTDYGRIEALLPHKLG